jgi:hypothetical protein
MSIPSTSQVVFLLALASGATAHAAAAYTWTEILVPNAMVVTAYGPKDLGEVALTNSNGSTGIYRYGRFQLQADVINNVGTVVGLATTTSDSHEAERFLPSRAHSETPNRSCPAISHRARASPGDPADCPPGTPEARRIVNLQADGTDEILERRAHRWVIVDDQDDT